MTVHLDEDPAFGARLREERERLGIEVHDLGHLGGKSVNIQKRYEKGTATIPIRYLQAIALRTDISIQYVLTGKR
jgi:transcriptional regulator with XRE-family HTH domain